MVGKELERREPLRLRFKQGRVVVRVVGGGVERETGGGVTNTMHMTDSQDVHSVYYI